MIRESDWPAQEPPADFAARTTAVLLRSAPAEVAASSGGVRRRKRWSIALLAATSLTATAWGALHFGSGPSEAPAPTPPVQALPSPPPGVSDARLAPPRPAEEQVQEAVEEPSRAPARKPSRPAPGQPSRQTPAAEPPPPASTSDEMRPLLVPRCECAPHGVICSCIE